MVRVTMKTKMSINNQKGGAAVEFALILPLLIFLIFGITEGGLFLYNQHVITNASREGTRAGIISTEDPRRVTDIQIRAVVRQYAENYLITFGNKGLPDGDIAIDPIWPRNTLSFGDTIEVDVSFDYKFLVLRAFGFGPINMRARTVMRME
jgi:hypothetical protein